MLGILLLSLAVGAQEIASYRPGETVAQLAERYDLDPVELAKFNGLLPDTVLGVGRTLKLPPGEPCEIPIEKAPEVRGLRLGMTEKAAAAEAGVRFEDDLVDRIYLRTVTQRGLQLQAFDDKLYLIRTSYDVKWNGVGEFIANFAPKLGLPKRGWRFGYGEYDARLTCRGFDVELRVLGDASQMKIWDTSVPKEIERLKREYEEDKKKGIRP